MTKSERLPAIRVGVHEAKTRLSELLRYVETGQEVEIYRGGTPVARLVPEAPLGRRVFGQDAGTIGMAADFDAPLPDDVLAEFGIS